MKFTNKQAANVVLASGANAVYTPNTAAQIRAFTVHNPTDAIININVSIGGLQYIKKAVTAGSTETLGALFNQQMQVGDVLNMTGEGLNVVLTVVEITE